MTRPVGIREVIELLPRVVAATEAVETVELPCRHLGVFLRVKLAGKFRLEVKIGIGAVIEQPRDWVGVHVVQIILGRHVMKQGLAGFVGR